MRDSRTCTQRESCVLRRYRRPDPLRACLTTARPRRSTSANSRAKIHCVAVSRANCMKNRFDRNRFKSSQLFSVFRFSTVFAAVCCPGFLFRKNTRLQCPRSWFSGEEFKRTKERKSTQRATTRAALLSLHELSKRCYTQLCSHGCGAWTWATRTLVSASIADYYRAESPNMWVCMRRAAGEERLGVLGARGAERGAGCAARDLRPSCGSVARSGGLRSHP